MSFRHLSGIQNRSLGKVFMNIGQAVIAAVILGLTMPVSDSWEAWQTLAAFMLGGLLIGLGVSITVGEKDDDEGDGRRGTSGRAGRRSPRRR